MTHSTTTECVKLLANLKRSADRIAKQNPIKIENVPRYKKYNAIIPALPAVNDVLCSDVPSEELALLEKFLSTVLNKIIETASLVTPSPKTTLNS